MKRWTAAKILVAEEFQSFPQLIRQVLRARLEFQVIGEASDGLDAIQKALKLQPDLVLLDVGLPKLNGIEVVRRLNELAAPPKVLFISQMSPDVVPEALRAGAKGFVQKMRVVRDLLPAIDAVLKNERFIGGG